MSSTAIEIRDAATRDAVDVDALEVPPGYTLTPAGVIPLDWRCLQMGDAVDLLTGFPFSSAGYAASGVRLVRGSNVKRGELDWQEDITKYWPRITPDIAHLELETGDLVIAMDGALVGRSYAVISDNDVPSLLLQRVARIRTFTMDQALLGHWVSSDHFVRHVDSVKTHTAIPHISPGDIRRFPIARPSTIAEQRAISEALSDVDELLRALDALIAKKQAVKQAAMQQLLTGRTRLPGFTGAWETKRLGELGEISGSGVDKKSRPEEVPVRLVNYLDVYHRTFIQPSDLTHAVSAKTDLARRCIVQKGDVFFTPTSEVPGDIARSAVAMQDIEDGVYSYHVVRLRLSVNWDLRFRAYAFATKSFLDEASRNCEGSGTRYVITLPRFRALTVHVPTEVTEQAAIATVLSDMDAEINSLKARRDKTQAIKLGMMQQLLTGRIRLVEPTTELETSA